jgi:alpha-glucosidase
MTRKTPVLGAAAVLALFAPSALTEQPAARAKAPAQASRADDPHEWWRHEAIYEIYPRSFADSNDDGIGDLNGITSKLDYLQELGIGAIWITPCFPSPQVDFGYDVSDYEQIDPMYGTLEDFDRLVAEGKKRGIRVILDLVVNHTSDRHKWFQESKSSKSSPKRDWYVWRDGKRDGQPPNNWLTLFGSPAWKLDAATGQHYYHFFHPEQPDLNWRNPEVEKAILDVSRYWYEKGVAGFRLDAVDALYEDPALPDNAVIAGTDKFGRPKQDEVHNRRLPEVHDALKKLRKVADQYDAVLVGETWTNDIAELKRHYGSGDEVQLPMNFMFAMVNKLSAREFRQQIKLVEDAGVWPVYVIGNHDIVRSWNRYGDGINNDAIAKALAALYLTLRGTPVMYYGEELGMENNDPKSKEAVKDPIGQLGWPKEKGRDGERTPMQWDAGPHAGFSGVAPWLPVPTSARQRNVDVQRSDPQSMLNFYKRLLALRRSHPALREGEYVPLLGNHPNVLGYLRRTKDAAVLVVVNMSTSLPTLLNVAAEAGVTATTGRVLAGTVITTKRVISLDAIPLKPFEVLIVEVGGAPAAPRDKPRPPAPNL